VNETGIDKVLNQKSVDLILRLRRSRWIALLVLSAILLGVFALYSGSLRLTTFYDDAYDLSHLSDRTIFSLFDIRPYGTLNYRPVRFIPWVLVRELFGWFRSDMLHYINLSVHVLNTALMAALARRMGRVWRLRAWGFPALTALFFGLFPFSYQAVLWPGALPHLLMTFYGLAGAHAYLSAHTSNTSLKKAIFIGSSAIMLLAACLSHEQGFLFGFLVVLLEAVLALREKQRPQPGAFFLAGLMLLYALFFKLFLQALWTDPSTAPLTYSIPELIAKTAYMAQGMISWLLILSRYVFGLPQQKYSIIFGLLVITITAVLLTFRHFKRLTLGWVSLAWWAAAIAPPVLMLSEGYVLSGPRLMYAASIGIALLYAGLVALFLNEWRSTLFKGILLVFVAVLCAWCVPYVLDKYDEANRLATGVRAIDTDLRSSPSTAKVLLIDLPLWSGPMNPTFLIGSEGMLFFQDDVLPASTMLASVGNTQRNSAHVRNIDPLAYGVQHLYGVGGPFIDAIALKGSILKSNYIYRFYYDSPGLRVQRLAIIQQGGSGSAQLARFTKGQANATLETAQAVSCPDQVVLDMTWSHVTAIQEPVAVFVHGMDTSGQRVAVADRDPVGGLLPLNEIPAGIQVNERRTITTTAITQVQIGIYSKGDGQRYPAARADNSLWENASVTIPVQIATASHVCVQ
jgi:hypothetical protein